MGRPECEREGGLGLEVSNGSGLLEWGVGVVSMGVSDLGSWRFSIDFSSLSSFCSTVVEDSFSSMDINLFAMDCSMVSCMTLHSAPAITRWLTPL